jgi:hypothetical protein
MYVVIACGGRGKKLRKFRASCDVGCLKLTSPHVITVHLSVVTVHAQPKRKLLHVHDKRTQKIKVRHFPLQKITK